MRLQPHIHRDPTWRQVGIHTYEQCRCGARRTTRAAVNLAGPTADDWPLCIDEHGRTWITSGWQHGNWRTIGYPTNPARWTTQ
jgi:hypothetical protein